MKILERLVAATGLQFLGNGTNTTTIQPSASAYTLTLPATTATLRSTGEKITNTDVTSVSADALTTAVPKNTGGVGASHTVIFPSSGTLACASTGTDTSRHFDSSGSDTGSNFDFVWSRVGNIVTLYCSGFAIDVYLGPVTLTLDGALPFTPKAPFGFLTEVMGGPNVPGFAYWDGTNLKLYKNVAGAGYATGVTAGGFVCTYECEE